MVQVRYVCLQSLSLIDVSHFILNTSDYYIKIHQLNIFFFIDRATSLLVIAYCNIMDKICIKGFLLRMALIWNIRQYSTPSNQVSTLVIVYKIYLFCFIFNQFYLQIESHFTKITTKAKWTQANRTLIRWQTFPTMSAWEVTASVNHTFLCNEKNKHKNFSKNIILIIALELRVHQLNENFKGMNNVSSTRRLRPKQIKNHLLNAMEYANHSNANKKDGEKKRSNGAHTIW